MEIQYSEKAKFFKPNIFNILNERKAKIAQKGVKVYDLSGHLTFHRQIML